MSRSKLQAMKTKIKILITTFSAAAFLSAVTPGTRDQGTVKKFQGVPVFILSEPVTPYEVTGKVTADDIVSWSDALTGTDSGRELKDNISVLVTNATRKAKKGKITFDAILTDDGLTGTCIRFTE